MTAGAAWSVLRRAAAHVVVDDVDAPALDDATSHHVFRVLRVRDGDPITVTDGAGRWRLCRAGGGGVLIVDGEHGSVAEIARPALCTVAVAIPKADRPEWMVQKLTELGVGRIVFLHAGRSVVRWEPERAAKHLAKLRRVAVEALQQSRRVWLPQIEGPLGASDVLPHMPVAEPGGRPLTADDAGVAIGPEGGWTDDELALAAGQVTLGDGVLRIETAALAAAVRLTADRG